MANAKLPVCPHCKSKNVHWRGFDATPPDAEAPPRAKAIRWECADCHQSFTKDADPVSTASRYPLPAPARSPSAK